MTEFNNTFKNLFKETNQNHDIRKPYFEAIRSLREKRTILSLFISFRKFSPLEQSDADILEEILANEDNTKGISLILDAPGGNGLAAERIIRICKSYSGKDFEVIVPDKAKSAATMICLGADKILMSKSSELGPIDPQVAYDIGQGTSWIAAHDIVSAYEELFARAVRFSDGGISTLLQQLREEIDAVKIKDLKSLIKLSEDMAINSLSNGMMHKASRNEIRNRIKPFTDPELTFSHDSGIDIELAKNSSLNVEEIDLNSPLWAAVKGLYMRSQYLVNSTDVAKIIETANDSYILS
ncbi:MAG: hypothetical protein OXE78_14985 [Gammaproteobacteria bacterium]|nr:hypothetical protein [Gammaproteobacteria bacterium]